MFGCQCASQDCEKLLTLTFDKQTNDFNGEVVEPFIQPFTVELLNIVSNAETFETKRKVMGTLNTLIEQSGILVSACHEIELCRLR